MHLVYIRFFFSILESSKSHVTPFLQWTRRDSKVCPKTNHSCIFYPLHRLQAFDTENGLQFRVNLHVYNYAGHSCDAKTNWFRLPSRFSPGDGFVIDINPDYGDKQSLQDVDAIFMNNEFCFHFYGFHHHLDTEIRVGLGTVRGKDDVVAFHALNSSMSSVICENGSKLRTGETYYTTIDVSCTGGSSHASSDGFRVVNEDDILSSITVSDGPGCSEFSIYDAIYVHDSVMNMTSFKFAKSVHIGKQYTIFWKNANDSFHLNINEALEYDRGENFVSFIPMEGLVNFSLINANNIYTYYEHFALHACVPEVNFTSSLLTLEPHFRISRAYREIVTNINLGIIDDGMLKNNCTSTEMPFPTTASRLREMEDGSYLSFAQPCVGNICLRRVFSDGFTLARDIPYPGLLEATISIKGSMECELSFKWEAFASKTPTMFYIIGVYYDANGHTNASDELPYVPDETGISILQVSSSLFLGPK